MPVGEDFIEKKGLEELFGKYSLGKYPAGAHKETALEAFKKIVTGMKTDMGSTTKRQGTSSMRADRRRFGAFAAPDLEAAIKMLDSPNTTGGLIMTKGGEYRVVMPADQSKHMRSGWEPIQYEREAGYFMPPEQAKSLARAKANPGDDFESALNSMKYMQGGKNLSFEGLVDLMEQHDLPNGKGLASSLQDLRREPGRWDTDSLPGSTTIGQMEARAIRDWAARHTEFVTRDYGLRELWRDLLLRDDYSNLVPANMSAGMVTDLPPQTSKSMAEAAAQTRANKTLQPVYLWREGKKWHYSVNKMGETTERQKQFLPEGANIVVDSDGAKSNPAKVEHSCSYRKTKRSKACGNRLTKMKNGRLYKCKKCGAKYEER